MTALRGVVGAEEAAPGRTRRPSLDRAAADPLLSLYRAAHAVRGYLTDRVLGPAELSWTGFLVLWTLWVQGPAQAHAMAESVGITKATLSGVLNTLESRGWLERSSISSDRRIVTLRLSARGADLMERIYPEFNRAESRVVRTVDASQLSTMTHALRRIVLACES